LEEEETDALEMAAKAHEAREEKKKGQAVVLAFFLGMWFFLQD